MSILQNLQAMFQRFVQYHNSAIIALAIVRTRNPQSWRTNLQAFSSRACKANSSLATWSIISSEISNRPGKAIKTNQASIGSSFGNLEGWGSSNINQHCSEGALAAIYAREIEHCVLLLIPGKSKALKCWNQLVCLSQIRKEYQGPCEACTDRSS